MFSQYTGGCAFTTGPAKLKELHYLNAVIDPKPPAIQWETINSFRGWGILAIYSSPVYPASIEILLGVTTACHR